MIGREDARAGSRSAYSYYGPSERPRSYPRWMNGEGAREPSSKQWLRLRVVSAASLVMALVACSGSSEKLKQFHRYGIAFEYPESWFVTTRPISSAGNPLYRFAVSTVPVHRTPADRGPCTPGIAKQLPPDGVLAYLREQLGRRYVAISLPRMQTRPRSFPLPTASSTALCGWARRGLWIPFKAKGRAFYLGVYVGPKATKATRRTLKHLLDGLEILPST